MNWLQRRLAWFLIPRGMYCHDGSNHNNVCPFWSVRMYYPYRENGYCSYLEKGDWELTGGLLWDKCKECGIKEG